MATVIVYHITSQIDIGIECCCTLVIVRDGAMRFGTKVEDAVKEKVPFCPGGFILANGRIVCFDL